MNHLEMGVRSFGVLREWQVRELGYVLPLHEALRLAGSTRHRGQHSVSARYARRWDDGAVMLLWSDPPGELGGSQLVGAFCAAWGEPTEETAAIFELAWSPDATDGESVAFDALRLLLGKNVTTSASVCPPHRWEVSATVLDAAPAVHYRCVRCAAQKDAPIARPASAVRGA